jgi:hypothetical protein
LGFGRGTNDPTLQKSVDMKPWRRVVAPVKKKKKRVEATGCWRKWIMSGFVLSRSMCDHRRGLDRWIDLLTTYTQHP